MSAPNMIGSKPASWRRLLASERWRAEIPRQWSASCWARPSYDSVTLRQTGELANGKTREPRSQFLINKYQTKDKKEWRVLGGERPHRFLDLGPSAPVLHHLLWCFSLLRRWLQLPANLNRSGAFAPAQSFPLFTFFSKWLGRRSRLRFQPPPGFHHQVSVVVPLTRTLLKPSSPVHFLYACLDLGMSSFLGCFAVNR